MVSSRNKGLDEGVGETDRKKDLSSALVPSTLCLGASLTIGYACINTHLSIGKCNTRGFIGVDASRSHLFDLRLQSCTGKHAHSESIQARKEIVTVSHPQLLAAQARSCRTVRLPSTPWRSFSPATNRLVWIA